MKFRLEEKKIRKTAGAIRMDHYPTADPVLGVIERIMNVFHVYDYYTLYDLKEDLKLYWLYTEGRELDPETFTDRCYGWKDPSSFMCKKDIHGYYLSVNWDECIQIDYTSMHTKVTRDQVKLKEMVYGYERIKERLVHGSLAGIEFKIMNYGTHPCSYIRLTTEQAVALGYTVGHEWENDAYCYDIPCHGGCTYTEANDPETKECQDGYIWAGWDYGHAGDFMGYCLRPDWPGILHADEHRYTTDELLDEMEDVIDNVVLYLAEAGVEV